MSEVVGQQASRDHLIEAGIDPELYAGTYTKVWKSGAEWKHSIELTPRFSTDFEAQLRDSVKMFRLTNQ